MSLRTWNKRCWKGAGRPYVWCRAGLCSPVPTHQLLLTRVTLLKSLHYLYEYVIASVSGEQCDPSCFPGLPSHLQDSLYWETCWGFPWAVNCLLCPWFQGTNGFDSFCWWSLLDFPFDFIMYPAVPVDCRKGVCPVLKYSDLFKSHIIIKNT